MLNFKRSVLITGVEERQKTDGSTYVLIHVLGDEGVTVSCQYKGDKNKIFGLKKMSSYECDFSFVGGKYPTLHILDIEQAK
jgi:hypothetical protein